MSPMHSNLNFGIEVIDIMICPEGIFLHYKKMLNINSCNLRKTQVIVKEMSPYFFSRNLTNKELENISVTPMRTCGDPQFIVDYGQGLSSLYTISYTEF
ncbi:hypothetical protein Hokovirus_1_276 [Hokovirus HKV1]|uniref:Uncharacterized protein n=1 Tax=Hokovirus HKV1 TaxID=1977638 RepID=A0A1V0SFA9_9VIRU|nr:hypothetical protein Hokovirus_1_276 [Hokovirus HKV1]